MTSGSFGDIPKIAFPVLDATKNPALRGVTTDAGESGVEGFNHATKSLGRLGGSAGVEGFNDATKSLGRLGGSDRVFGQNAGVYGESGQQGVFGHSTDRSGTGVYGGSIGGSGFGVRGDSTDGVAVQGQSFGNGIAVQGIGGRLAGRFEGNVEVTGSLTVQGVNLVQRIQQLEGQLNQANQAISAAQQRANQAEQRANQAEQKANAVQRNLEQALTPVSLKIAALEQAILKLQGISHTHNS